MASSNVSSIATSLTPLAVDVAVPLAVYFAARDLAGIGVVGAYLLSSVVPVVRSVADFALHRTVNALALMMLSANVAGLALTFVTGSIRIGTAKSAAVSAVIATAFILSALRGRPVLSDGLRAFVTRGDADRETAWSRFTASVPKFRSLENRFTLIYGLALLTECVARLVVSVVAPVTVLGWLPTVFLAAAIVVAVIVAGGAAADPINRMIDADVARRGEQ